jgi:hypothetical protein
MNNMLNLFGSAAEEMKLEGKAESELTERIDPLIQKVDKLEDQNKTIAEGLVAIANIVKEIRKQGDEHEIEHTKPHHIGEGVKPLEPKGFNIPKPIEKPDFSAFDEKEPEHPPFSTGSPRVVVKRPMPNPAGPNIMPPPGMPGPMPPPNAPGPMPPPGMPGPKPSFDNFPPMPPPNTPGAKPLPPLGPPGIPPLGGPMPPKGGPLPPLPPLESPKKKKGLFGFLKKK